jgi:hypothetical protein
MPRETLDQHRLKIATLALINAKRHQHGFDSINWNDDHLTEVDKTTHMVLAAAVIEAWERP